MKKIFTVLLAVMVAAGSVSAKEAPKKKADAKQAYTNSIGLVAGLGMGLQYKKMVSNHFTIIEEFGYFTCMAGAASASGGGGYGGAIDNLVLAYQAKCAEGKGIRLDYYIGGQIKAGYSGGMGVAGGVIGFGAAGGIEAKMINAPIAFSFDFRPGYAMQLVGTPGGVALDHMLDYSFNLGVRYTF